MSDENKNIENKQEENQNRQECNKSWWKKLLGYGKPDIFHKIKDFGKSSQTQPTN